MAPNARFARILEEGKCIGCGLCAAMFPKKLEIELADTGYLRPAARQRLSHEEVDAVYAVCPGVVQTGQPEDLASTAPFFDEIWGPYVRIERAYAADPDTRHRAATGGVLTALSDYLIASGKVKAILHVAPGGMRPSFGRAQISTDRAAVLEMHPADADAGAER